MTQQYPCPVRDDSDEQLAERALNLGDIHFNDLCNRSLPNGNDLYVEIGAIVDGEYVKWGSAAYGNEKIAAGFAVNVNPVDGKLATVIKYRTSSATAYREHGDEIPEGPQRWQGGVYHVAQVLLPDGTWKTCELVCAASGVESSYDQAVALDVIGNVAATWEQRELALFEEAAAAPAPAEA